MELQQTLKTTAADGKAMTLAEVDEFIQKAKAAGAPDGACVEVTSSMAGKLKRLELKF
jgi:hypothetical protein